MTLSKSQLIDRRIIERCYLNPLFDNWFAKARLASGLPPQASALITERKWLWGSPEYFNPASMTNAVEAETPAIAED